MFTVSDWFYGSDDCEPPEPDKRWLAILDDDGEEFCIVVQRKQGETFTEGERIMREQRATGIADALNGKDVDEAIDTMLTIVREQRHRAGQEAEVAKRRWSDATGQAQRDEARTDYQRWSGAEMRLLATTRELEDFAKFIRAAA